MVVTTYDHWPVLDDAAGEPVPGSPDVLDGLARGCRLAAIALRADVALLRGAIQVDGWTGPASRAFAATVRGLPRDLDRAAASYDAVGRILTGYAAELREAQRRGRAAAAERERANADLVFGVALGHGATGPELLAELARRNAERERLLAAADRELDVARTRAAAAASRAARRILAAAGDAPYDRPGLLSRLADGAGDWVEEHAEVLAALSQTLAIVSSVAAMMSAVPALTPVLAPLAAGAGVASVIIDAALATRRKASWADVAVGAVSTAVPGPKAVTAAAHEADTVAAGRRLTGQLVRGCG